MTSGKKEELTLKRQKKDGDPQTTSPTSPLSLTDDVILSMIPKDELLKLAKRLNSYLEKEHDVTKDDIYGTKENTVPLSIFSHKLSPLEAIVKFLKEDRRMNYHKIGTTLQRDERGIWVTYRNATKKLKEPIPKKEDDILVPINIFSKDLSILESVVRYLRDQKDLRGSEIARLLNKSTSTIWTVYNRAKEKAGETK